MIQPLIDVALDNTLPQSAYGWFSKPQNPSLDLQALGAFETFVDAYIYAPKRYFPLPNKITTDIYIHEPFITLWQEGAEKMCFAADDEALVSEELLWKQFNESVRFHMKSWSRWLQFQWTPEITVAFQMRVPNWKNQLEKALEKVRFEASVLNQNTSSPISDLVSDLKDKIQVHKVDREYRRFERKFGSGIHPIACAYAWNWFRRGASYAGRTHGMSIKFHDLRDMAVVTPIDVPHESVVIQNNRIDWGYILRKSIEQGVISNKDSYFFCDVLRKVRDTVHTDSHYKELLEQAKTTENADVRTDCSNRAIALALIRADVSPPFKESTLRGRIVKAIAKTTVDAIKPSSEIPLKHIAYEIVDLGLNNKLARKVEYNIRSRLQKKDLWKVFRIPGRE